MVTAATTSFNLGFRSSWYLLPPIMPAKRWNERKKEMERGKVYPPLEFGISRLSFSIVYTIHTHMEASVRVYACIRMSKNSLDELRTAKVSSHRTYELDSRRLRISISEFTAWRVCECVCR